MKKSIYIAFSGFIGIIIFAFVLQLIGLEKLKHPFSSFSFFHLIMYAAISVLIVLVIVMRWSIILKAHGYRVSFTKMIFFMLSGKAVCYLTPSAQVGGEAARTYLLKHENVPTEKGLSSVIIDKVLDLTSNSMFALLALPIMILFFPFSIYLKIAMGFAILLMVFLVISFYDRSFRGKGFFKHAFRFLRLHKVRRLQGFEQKLVDTEENISHFFNHNRTAFRYAVFYSVLTWVLMFLEFKFGLLVFGYDATPIQVVLALSMVGFSYMVPIPAALGILEASEASMFTFLGINPGIGLALSFLVRARDVIITSLGIGGLSHYGYKIAKVAAAKND